MPAASRPRSSVFGTRPTASSRCVPGSRGAPSLQSRPTERPSASFCRLMHSASSRSSMPSARRKSWIASDTSSSSRATSARAHLDDGDAAAEAAEHLRELEPDVAAADDHEMRRDEVEIHHRDVRQIGHRIEPRHLRDQRPAADVDEDLVRAQHLPSRPGSRYGRRSARVRGRPSRPSGPPSIARRPRSSCGRSRPCAP